MKNTRTIVRVLSWDCPATCGPREATVPGALLGERRLSRRLSFPLGFAWAVVGSLRRHDSRTADRRRRPRRATLLRDLARPGPRRPRDHRRPRAALRPPAALEGPARRAAVAAAVRVVRRPRDRPAPGHGRAARRPSPPRRAGGGERVRYDALVVATGSEPVRLPGAGRLRQRAGAAHARGLAAAARGARGGRSAGRRRRRADRARGRLGRSRGGRRGDRGRGGSPPAPAARPGGRRAARRPAPRGGDAAVPRRPARARGGSGHSGRGASGAGRRARLGPRLGRRHARRDRPRRRGHRRPPGVGLARRRGARRPRSSSPATSPAAATGRPPRGRAPASPARCSASRPPRRRRPRSGATSSACGCSASATRPAPTPS